MYYIISCYTILNYITLYYIILYCNLLDCMYTRYICIYFELFWQYHMIYTSPRSLRSLMIVHPFSIFFIHVSSILSTIFQQNLHVKRGSFQQNRRTSGHGPELCAGVPGFQVRCEIKWVNQLGSDGIIGIPGLVNVYSLQTGKSLSLNR